jgi:hypothetical protein
MNSSTREPDDRHHNSPAPDYEPVGATHAGSDSDYESLTVTAWTIERVRRLGLTTDVATAAAILGISRTKAYALAKSGDFPVVLIRVGRRYLVPIPTLLHLLGAGGDKPVEAGSTY